MDFKGVLRLWLDFDSLKDRVCRFGGTFRKIGISGELSVHFRNAIHQIEGNHLL